MFDRKTTRKENEEIAKQYGKHIVDAIASRNYADMLSNVDEADESWGMELTQVCKEMEEMIEMYKQYNQISEISSYDAPCENQIIYADGSKREKERFYYNDEDSEDYDFSYEIDLLPTDLTLILDFNYYDGHYTVVFVDIHQA